MSVTPPLARYSSSYEGIGLLLRSPMIADVIMKRGELVRQRAESTAPVSDPALYTTSGEFKKGFVLELTIGGRRKDRVRAVIRNTDPAGIYIEKGTSKAPGHHTLYNALQAAR